MQIKYLYVVLIRVSKRRTIVHVLTFHLYLAMYCLKSIECVILTCKRHDHDTCTHPCIVSDVLIVVLIHAKCFIFSRLFSLRHSVNGDFCGHSSFVLWHENNHICQLNSWTPAKSESWGLGVGLNCII